VGKYAHTFVGQALFLAVREFLLQGAVSDSVKVMPNSFHFKAFLLTEKCKGPNLRRLNVAEHLTF